MTFDLIQAADDYEHFTVICSLEDLERAAGLNTYLTAEGILPTQRKVQYGNQHSLFCCMLLIALDNHEGIFTLSSRDTTFLSKTKLGSGVINHLERMVASDLLDQHNNTYTITPRLQQHMRHLSDAEIICL